MILTRLVDWATPPGVSSKWPQMMSVRRLHSSATRPVLARQLVDAGVSCVFVFVAVGPLRQIRFPECPAMENEICRHSHSY